MQNKNKNSVIISSVIVVLAAVIIGLAVRIRSAAPKDEGLIIETENQRIVIAYDRLSKESFTGEIVNGKGEVSRSEYTGVALRDLLADNGIELTENTAVAAVSEDNYSAELTGREILTEGKVYIAVTSDGNMLESIDGGQGVQLVVYGDANAKRQVRYLKTIIVH